jgi:hypothetical protein
VKVPRIQIITVEELLAGKKLEIPNIDPSALKKAQKEETGEQVSLHRWLEKAKKEAVAARGDSRPP